MAVNKFKFENATSKVEEPLDETNWVSQTLTKTPFFLQTSTNVAFLAGNSVF
jgi:hypothetical protein